MNTTPFVLVHGGWHGGWCWRAVAAALRAAGHDCHTPTLTGLGDRAHLREPLGERLGLHAHVDDVAALLVAGTCATSCWSGTATRGWSSRASRTASRTAFYRVDVHSTAIVERAIAVACT